jgi:hypothetical protein
VIAIPPEVSRPKRLFFVPNPATGSTVAWQRFGFFLYFFLLPIHRLSWRCILK